MAQIVGASQSITAWLSAVHAMGFALVMSAGLVWNLRASGVLLSEVSHKSIARPATRLLGLGLTLSLVTGLALFAPRASYTAPGGVFQLKIALILVAASYQLTANVSVLRRPVISSAWLRANGILGTMLWLALAVTACWFILFE